MLATACGKTLEAADRTRTHPYAGPARSITFSSENATYADVVALQDDADDDGWRRIKALAMQGRRAHNAPWRRCVAVLKEHHARSCVIEYHYVCLDRRSETASFAAQLDSHPSRVSIRLHFFAKRLATERIYHLDDEADSYLGYIVCRVGETPLVGRAVIKLPPYLADASAVTAAVWERVNFFGQYLRVQGVPFMQQDARFANCAHAAIWSSLYTAYRRGRIGRVLIAEVVAASDEFHPMSPTIPLGLEVREVRKVFRHFGLSARTFDTPQFEHSDLPNIPGSILRIPKDDIDRLSLATFAERTSRRTDSAEAIGYAEKARETFYKRPIYYVDDAWVTWSNRDDVATNPAYHLLVQIIDTLLDLCVRPYVESGFPVYCHSSDEPHATVLCGIASDHGQFVYYVHDDQFGPYLGTKTLLLASKATFQHQSYTPVTTGRRELTQPATTDESRSSPQAIEPLARSLAIDVERGISNFVVATPQRLTLSPMGALAATYRTISNLLSEGTDTADFFPIDYFRFRTLIMLGLDYKRDRRTHFRSSSRPFAFFSSFHLAEWVIVVEVSSATTPPESSDVSYEFVYDGTSDDSHPLLQLSRVGRQIAGLHPHGDPTMTRINITREVLPRVTLPEKASK
ncbi:hypothetical protein [Mycolicibacterium fluoranthenivorans]|uniref:Uncharacterized protein n=1 Tax=Mycolicibacterium fluoranthenivorans TaxID=258505 RepID=A0A1G4WKR6_9MYCO|nr:hypothetical protein [Mycolicibacterium fluoranthenivorans]SCX24795.1 hypothetical protein SAMN02799620_03780 [Mycolicibacterium fluoranthenivorans]